MSYCKNCHNYFESSSTEKDFYNRVKVKEPSFCFDCRTMRKMAFRNERNLYRRKCGMCQAEIISMYSPTGPSKVYCEKCWWSDNWDGLVYGQEIKLDQPFFQQIAKLQRQVPRVSLCAVDHVENSPYCNWVDRMKDCYLTHSSSICEACYYSDLLVDCRNCVDATNLKKCEACYFSIDSSGCYNVNFSRNMKDCLDCDFCFDCASSSNCLLSYNLRHGQYRIFNVEYSPESFFKEKEKLLNSSEAFAKTWEKFLRMVKYDAIHRHAKAIKCDEVTGDDLYACRKTYNSFDSAHTNNCTNIVYGDHIKDCLDSYAIVNGSEMCYDVFSTTNSNNSMFSYGLWLGNYNMKYCDTCSSCHDCFGCVGLRKKSFCILNKQYSEVGYFKKIKEIEKIMKKTGEADQFFPVELSPFAYNETVAQECYPLVQEEVLSRGWGWKEDFSKPTGLIDKDVLSCRNCQKNYRLIEQEKKFYVEHKLPVPALCPDCRHTERMKLRNPRKLWPRKCTNCHEEKFQTTYAPNRSEKVFGEKCYLKSVY